MEELSANILQILTDFLVYGLLANLVIYIIVEIAGDKIRFRIRFCKKHIWKSLTGLTIQVNGISKPVQFPQGKTWDEINSTLREYLSRQRIQMFVSGSRATFTIEVGRRKIGTEISAALEAASGTAEGLEMEVHFPVRYRNFSDDFIDLVSTIKTLEGFCTDLYGTTMYNEAVQFTGLKKSFELNGVLRNHGLESLSTSRGTLRLDLADSVATFYGSLDSQLKGLLADIITYYY